MKDSTNDWSLRTALKNGAKFDRPAAEAALAASGLSEEKIETLGNAFEKN